mgnify:FL=1
MTDIAYADFQKLEIRVAQIKTAEDIPGADKIYKLVVDLGVEQRELVAGIKLYYTKEELIGRKVLILANLEPKIIRGITSHGMVLCAHNEDRSLLTLSTVEKDIPLGALVS